MTEKEERGVGTGIIIGGVGGVALATAIATLMAARPARAAPTDEKLDYLIEVLTTLVPVLAEVSEHQVTFIELFQQWLAAQGIEPGVELTVTTPWIAKAPEEIFNQAVRSVGTFDCDRMADYRRGKRILFKVESSLDQAVNVQLVGNIGDSITLATNINAALPVAANGNITIGLAWDDWHPFVGARIIAAVAPTTGMLKLEYSIQE